MDKQQSLRVENRYMLSLDVFEGPLDLLLHLIRKHELDIFDIPISFVTRKYLEYLDLMKELNLDLASDYLEMAAQLTFIKSKMMLPDDKSTDDDDMEQDGPDPREELVRQLLEYQKYKTAAEELAARPQAGRDTFPKSHRDTQEQERELESPGLFALMEALQKVFDRIDMEENFTDREISITRISISARIHQILDTLLVVKRIPFMDLFEEHITRTDIVTTFLAILEMTKLGLSKIHQAGPGTEIHISASADEAEANRVLSENKLEE